MLVTVQVKLEERSKETQKNIEAWEAITVAGNEKLSLLTARELELSRLLSEVGKDRRHGSSIAYVAAGLLFVVSVIAFAVYKQADIKNMCVAIASYMSKHASAGIGLGQGMAN